MVFGMIDFLPKHIKWLKSISSQQLDMFFAAGDMLLNSIFKEIFAHFTLLQLYIKKKKEEWKEKCALF